MKDKREIFKFKKKNDINWQKRRKDLTTKTIVYTTHDTKL